MCTGPAKLDAGSPVSSQSLEDDFLDDLLAVQLDFGFDFGAASQGTPSDSLDMVQLGFIRIVSSLGWGCRTNPSQGSGRQLLPRASIPGSLSIVHFIFEVMSGHGQALVHVYGTGYCCLGCVLVCSAKSRGGRTSRTTRAHTYS